jgi:arginyl-tRNA synthetase
MSKRAGDFVTLREVVDEVGADSVRFIMLFRKNDAPLDFDFVKVLEQSRDNPVFYVQYAHARVMSVLRGAAEAGVETGDESLRATDLSSLSDPAELAVARKLAEWPRAVEQAAQAHEPHRIAFYLYDMAAEFHALWNRGKEDPGLRFLREDDPALTGARIALIRAVSVVIAAGLGILGVTPVNEMR